MKDKQLVYKYIAGDTVAAMLAWSLFFLFRKIRIEAAPYHDVNNLFCDTNFWKGIIMVPIGWLLLYSIIGSYHQPMRKARLRELGETAIASIIGVTVLFFAVMLDDAIETYKYYYISFTNGCR